MLSTFIYMDSAIAVNEPMEPASTFAWQPVKRNHGNIYSTPKVRQEILSSSNSRMYIEEVGLQPLNIPREHSKGEANQLHDDHNMVIHITDGNSPGLRPLKDDWNFIPHTEPTSEDYGRQQSTHEASSTMNPGCSDCHLQGTVHITCWDRDLSKFQNPVCPIWWSFQSNVPVPWILSNWWTYHPITCCWPH